MTIQDIIDFTTNLSGLDCLYSWVFGILIMIIGTKIGLFGRRLSTYDDINLSLFGYKFSPILALAGTIFYFGISILLLALYITGVLVVRLCIS